MGIAKKSGAWFTYEGEQLGQGRENAKTFLSDNPEIMMEMEDKVRQAAGITAGAEDGFSGADEEPIELD
jgi:recombination protein RecA